MDGILTGTTTLGLGGPDSNSNEGAFHTFQISSLESYIGYPYFLLVGEYYHSAWDTVWCILSNTQQGENHSLYV